MKYDKSNIAIEMNFYKLTILKVIFENKEENTTPFFFFFLFFNKINYSYFYQGLSFIRILVST